MLRSIALGACALVLLGITQTRVHAEKKATGPGPLVIVCPKEATPAEQLAAREIRRYFYLRTGTLGTLASEVPQPQVGPPTRIVVGSKTHALVKQAATQANVAKEVDALGPEQYRLKLVVEPGKQYRGPLVLVAGGDAAGTLYGAYRLAEHLGVRFYMHGDVVPDVRSDLIVPAVDETGRPLFDRRGIQPFHDFPEGPDWWNADAYKAVLAQLPKMRMNFFGLHTYPESAAGPEPLVWIGVPGDVGAGSQVKFSYPSRHFTTQNAPSTQAATVWQGGWAWGYRPMKTNDYVFGAAQLFDRDDFGADYMRDTYPWNKMTPEQSNGLFDRMGGLLGETFGFARRLGIKTCLGTETPLTIPAAVKERLKAAGKNPADPAVVQEVYEGMFRRIAQTHPLDYYWFWTPEDWTWQPVSQKQIDGTVADFRAAVAAAERVKAPFTLATCGWVLGPPQQPSLFDDMLPKQMPMSCISRTVGNTPVETGFAKVKGRPKWSIPWMEDDPGMILPQLWVGRMRRDAADSLAYGCTGLMGIHWRTRVLGPNVSALAKAAWDQAGWNSDPPGSKPRYCTAADFYADWAQAEFGPEASVLIAAIFTKIDCHLPRPADWTDGPGGIKPDGRPWAQVAPAYAFVDELAALRDKVRGPGNLERFDYWLATFRYLRAMNQVDCTWARFNEAMNKVKAEKNADAQKKLAGELALPIRKQLVAEVAELHGYLLDTVTTYGELGTVANWQQHTMPSLLIAPGEELSKILGQPLPEDCQPSKKYAGKPRLAVPTVRTCLAAGEPLRLTVLALGGEVRDAKVRWRTLGKGDFAAAPLTHIARGVYEATLPATDAKDDFEYYIEATVGGTMLHWPPTAPAMGQSVVVMPEK